MGVRLIDADRLMDSLRGNVLVDVTPVLEEAVMEQPAAYRWIPVEERLPESEKIVLICAERRYQVKTYKIISTAFYTDGTMWSEESAYGWNEMDVNYNEEKDDYLIPQGWWEDTNYSEEFNAVDDCVLAWMPLPEPYEP